MRLCVVTSLASLVVGVQYGTTPTAISCDLKPCWKKGSLDGIDQHRLQQAVEEIDAGPDPFFADLIVKLPKEDEETEINEAAASATLLKRTYAVEVYENESRGIGRRWRELRSASPLSNRRWTYKDGSAALSPSEILPPDDWDWASEWKIDRSEGRDTGGWEYAKKVDNFKSPLDLIGKRLTDRYRRRRWIRAMRPQQGLLQQGTTRDSLQLEDLEVTTGKGTPTLRVHEYEAESFRFELGKYIDADLLPAPDVQKLDDRLGTSVSIRGFSHAATTVKGWWADEFTFRGFGIGIVKPIFRGMLLRPDVGVGIRLPITLHFRFWERQAALPSVSASFFILWPPAVQASKAISYPAELLQEWTTTAVRKIMVPSKEEAQVRQRKETVQRVGFTVGVRYSATYGFQWWLSPYFFLLPGVRLLWDVYESFMALLLSSMTLAQRSASSDMSEEGERIKDTKNESEQALWLLALRSWATAKTSGLGYSLYLSGNRLSGALIINFMPFFLPAWTMNLSTPAKMVAADIDENVKSEADIKHTAIFAPEIDNEATSSISEIPSMVVTRENK